MEENFWDLGIKGRLINIDTKYLGRDKVEWVKPAHSSVDLVGPVEQILKLRVSFNARDAKTCWADNLSRSFNDCQNVFFPFVAPTRKSVLW
jgi:hypothetical protein